MAKLTADLARSKALETALIDDFGETTWDSLDRRVNRLVNGLRAVGLTAGDTIAVVAGNSREWFEIAMACSHGGWTYVPANWHWVADELAYLFQDAGAKVVICDHRFASVVASALSDERADSVLAVIGIEPQNYAPQPAFAGEPRFQAYEALLSAAAEDEPDNQQLGGPMFYTSGTTGRPKGVRSAWAGAAAPGPEVLQAIASGMSAFLPSSGRTLLCGPFYHSAQWAFSFLPFVAGASVVMRHRFDAAESLELIDRFAVTNIHLVPTQMKRLLDVPAERRAQFKGESLHIVWHGAAPCPPSVKQEMIEWWGPKINEYYGSTEGSVISMISSSEWLTKGGSVGKPSPAVEVIVVDDNGERITDGRDGTLYFRNLSGADFRYHNDDEKTEAAHLTPGVFTTGDVGHLDDEGYLWLTDRKIDMIISGGVNIYPAEIEGVLASHSSVADVAVIGVPDDEFGENVKAVVQLADGVPPSPGLEAELLAHCHDKLARYKAPKSFDFIDLIPRSAAGKIIKGPLRQPYWQGRGRSI